MDSPYFPKNEALKAKSIRTFVRRSGRMSSAQRRSYETLFPLYAINGDEEGIIETSFFFGNTYPLNIEIGFGMGRATAAIALNNININYLGIEVHRPGIGRLLWEIEKSAIKNIRIVEGDAADVLERRIGDNTVSAFHIFFPDPWPKKKHHKRRLMTRPFTDLLAAKLLPGGYIYMVSDWADYGEWALSELSATPALVNKYAAFADQEEWRPETEFEAKGRRKNLKTYEIYFVKRNLSWINHQANMEQM